MDYDKVPQACYIYNQNTGKELYGSLYEDYFSDLFGESQIQGSVTPKSSSNRETLYWLVIKNESTIGTSLVDFISSDENEVDESVKSDFELLRGYIDLCNENEAFFTNQWLKVFMDAASKARTEIEHITEDRLYNGEMKFLDSKLSNMFKFNRSSGNTRENENDSNAPLILSPEQKNVSKTMLFIETYKNPAACYYRSLEILVENRLMPKRCGNCGKYFIPDKRSDALYCSRQAPQDPKKTCKKYGAEKAWKKNMESDEAGELYRKFYQRKQTKVKRNPSEESLLDFENYKIVSKQWRADVKAGIRTEADFIDWLKSL